ncbi:MAG: DsbA family protein [Kofleriaceae bacterium]|nr:DsbA family protein [Kofleriaceae bacterium]
MIHNPTLPLVFSFVAGLGLASCKSGNDTANAAKTVVSESPKEKPTQCGIGLEMAPGEAVITIDGKAILCSELMEKSHISLLHAEAEYREKIRDLQQQALAEMIDKRLLDAEMKGSSQSIEEFIGTHVRAEPVTQEEMLEFYKQAVAEGQPLPPYEEVKSELSNFINEKKQQGAMLNYRASLRAKADVKLTMPILLPPVFDVDTTGESKGPDTAPVTIVEFSDFECGYCGQAEPTVQKIVSTYGDKVRLVYRDLPLPSHAQAPKASEATHCAQKQGKYWEMHAKLFANQRALEIPQLKTYAGELGLDQAAFDSCLDDGNTAKIVADSLAEAERLGVNGTPAFFVNGRFLSGAQPYERFAELIDYELADK